MSTTVASIVAVGDVNVAQNVGFGVIALMMIVAAIRVVSTNDVVHAALWLVLVLAGVAAQYILAAAEFVAVSQVLVYIGAVMVLFLFGIMLTRAQIGGDRDVNNPTWALGIPVAVLLFGVLAWAVLDGVDELPGVEDSVIVDRGPAPTVGISDGFLGPYLVPFLASRSSCSPPRSEPSCSPARIDGGAGVLAANFLLLAAVIFCIGVYGVIARRNAVLVLMSVELILNSVNLNLVAFALMNGSLDGQVFALFVIAIAAAEVGVGLAMVLMVYRNRRSISLDELSEMKG